MFYLTKGRARYALVIGASIFTVALALLATPVVTIDDPESVVLYDRHGQLLSAAIAADEQWRFPPATDVPRKIAAALTAFEDRRFYAHPGVDPLAILRATVSNLKAGHVVSGGSTLTMQVVRLSRRGQSRTVLEKVIEAWLALRLEIAMSKESILRIYASHAPFGGNVVGVDAAAWRYFGRSAHRLSWAEAATLSVLPNAPALIHPGRNRARLHAKRDRLLDTLQRLGTINAESCALAKLEPLPPNPLAIPRDAPHLLDRFRKHSARGHKGQLTTTLDADLQRRANEVVLRHHVQLAGNGIHNAAAVILDVNSGEALAYIGNVVDLKQPKHGNAVDVITAARSTGSVLKPLLFAGALEAGELLPQQLVADIPTRFGGFAPENFNKTYSGAVRAASALARSLNVPAVRLLDDYGVGRFYALLQSMGMTTLTRPASHYGLALILGGSEGTLWELTSMYANCARLLNRVAATQNTAGSFFTATYGAAPVLPLSRENAIGPGACYVTLDAMLEVRRPGTQGEWRTFASGRKVAWKTGTSYGFRDGWAIGVTPDYAIGVWTGNGSGEGRPRLTGFSAAAPILFDLFNLLPTTGWFKRPDNDLMHAEVCADSGLRLGPNCPRSAFVTAPTSGLQAEVCAYCKEISCDADCQSRVHGDCESVSNIHRQKWFVLPPGIEWFYKKKHSRYRALPPWRRDCRGPSAQTPSLSCLYPKAGAQVLVPRELDGNMGRAIFEAAHRDRDVLLHWHIDDEYIGSTESIHRMAVAPAAGAHTLTLVDELGEMLQRRFVVLGPK